MKRGLMAIAVILKSHDRVLTPYQVLLSLLLKYRRDAKSPGNAFFVERYQPYNLLMSSIIKDLCAVVPAFDQCDSLIIQNLNKMLPLVRAIPSFGGLIRAYLEIYPHFQAELDNAIITELEPQAYGIDKRNPQTAADVLADASQIIPLLSPAKKKNFSNVVLNNIACFTEDSARLAFPDAIGQGLTLRFSELEEKYKLLFMQAIAHHMVTLQDFKQQSLTLLRIMFVACFPYLNEQSQKTVLDKLIELAVGKKVAVADIAQYMRDVFKDISWELKRVTIENILSKHFDNNDVLQILELLVDKIDLAMQKSLIQTFIEGVKDKGIKANVLNQLIKILHALLVAIPDKNDYLPILRLFKSNNKDLVCTLATTMSSDFTLYPLTKRGLVYSFILANFESTTKEYHASIILNLNANIAHIPKNLTSRCLTLLFGLLTSKDEKTARAAYQKILHLVQAEPTIFQGEILKELLLVLTNKDLIQHHFHIPLLKDINIILSAQDRIDVIEKLLKIRPHRVSAWWKEVEPVVSRYVEELSLQVPAEKIILDKLTDLWLKDNAIDDLIILAPHVKDIPEAQVKLTGIVNDLLVRLLSQDYSECMSAMETLADYLEFLQQEVLEEIFAEVQTFLTTVNTESHTDVIQFIGKIGSYADTDLNEKICQFLMNTLNDPYFQYIHEACRCLLSDLLIAQSSGLQIEYLQHLQTLAENGDKFGAWFLFKKFINAEPKLFNTAAKEVLQMLKFGIIHMENDLSGFFQESKLKTYFLPYLLVELYGNKKPSNELKQLVEKLPTEFYPLRYYRSGTSCSNHH